MEGGENHPRPEQVIDDGENNPPPDRLVEIRGGGENNLPLQPIIEGENNPPPENAVPRKFAKFAIARRLGENIVAIRERVLHHLNPKKEIDIETRQCAAAVYLMDKLSLRHGFQNTLANTYGCGTLLNCHVKLREVFGEETNVILFLFKGKRNVPYVGKLSVPESIFQVFQTFQGGRELDESLFNGLTEDALNSYLANFVDGLTSKHFRHYNASQIYEAKLSEYTNENQNIFEKIENQKKAVRDASQHLNHRKNGGDSNSNWTSCLDTQIREQIIQNDDFLPVGFDQLVEILNANSQVHDANAVKSYIDPRITVAWVGLRNDLELSDVLSPGLVEEFAWAQDTPNDFVFQPLPLV